MIRIIKYTIAAMLGAIIAWAVMEPTSLMPDDGSSVGFTAVFVIGLVSGLMVGLLLGIAEAGSGLSPRDAGKSVAMGALVGAAGGLVGFSFGNAFYQALHGASSAAPSLFSFILLLIGRGLGWALVGMFIGLSQGIATMSPKRMINGAVGGFIGGGFGGSVFEILAWMNRGGAANFPTGMIRLTSFATTGAAIGLFIGLIEEVAKQAWLVRLVGRNEGKEYTLYKESTVIGRSEFADIPVFTDADISERHVAISVAGKRYFVEDLNSAQGTTVDGRQITTKEPLHDGDIIIMGKTRFLFRDKASAPKYVQNNYEPQASSVQIPTSQHICPFCGAIKDAAGNCDCSVGAAPPAAPTAMPVSQQPTIQQQAPINFGELYSHSDATQPMPSPSAGGARLSAVSGPYAGKTFALKPGTTELGRDASKDIGLPDDKTVSRSHARVVQEGAGYVLYDNGSTNGTMVNGAKITRHELKTGDTVQVGNTQFRFDI
ncbi:MAG: FHA domain-containing protein [Armatimonadota bacterium]|nr:FHA domain-containing protein [bacterium]